MQKIARQNGLPATAFVWYGKGVFNLRWFTAKKELTLCGHATLASAHVLFSEGIVPAGNKIHFKTAQADLYAWYQNDWVTMDFPAYDCEPIEVPKEMKTVFGGKFKSGFFTQNKFLIELENETAVRDFIPDPVVLNNHKCIITAGANAKSSYDFVSRFFDLPDGIPEDAVTGFCSLQPGQFLFRTTGEKSSECFSGFFKRGVN